jgi:hypothetical protein
MDLLNFMFTKRTRDIIIIRKMNKWKILLALIVQKKLIMLIEVGILKQKFVLKIDFGVLNKLFKKKISSFFNLYKII